MSELPKGWEQLELADCVEILDSKRKPVNNRERQSRVEGKLKSELYPYYGATGQVGYIDDYLFDEELVALGEDGVPFFDPLKHKAYIISGKTWVNNHAHVLKGGKVNNRYLCYYLNQADYHGYVNGATRLKLTQANMRKMPIKVAPLEEQKRIADKLDSVLAKVEAAQARLDKIPAILKRFRQSVLAAATSGELTKEWRKKNKTDNVTLVVEKVQESKEGKLKVRTAKGWNKGLNLYELPMNWGWVSNYKLAEDRSNAICAGPFGTIFKAKDFRDQGVPIIFLRHVKENGFNQNKPNYMDEAVWQELHQEYSVFGGELLVTKLGDPPGEACIYPEGAGVAMVTPDVLKMSVDSRVAITEYLQAFFNSPNCKDMVRDLAFGATRLRIDIAMFKNFPIPLPPLDEQKEIVMRVGHLFEYANAVEKQYNTAKERLDVLTHSILSKAFKGELLTSASECDEADIDRLIEAANA